MQGYYRVLIVVSGVWLLGLGAAVVWPAYDAPPVYHSLTNTEQARTYYFMQQEYEAGRLRPDIARMFERARDAGQFKAAQYNYVRVENTNIIVPFDLTATQEHIHSIMKPLIAERQKQRQRNALLLWLAPVLGAWGLFVVVIWVRKGFVTKV